MLVSIVPLQVDQDPLAKVVEDIPVSFLSGLPILSNFSTFHTVSLLYSDLGVCSLGANSY